MDTPDAPKTTPSVELSADQVHALGAVAANLRGAAHGRGPRQLSLFVQQDRRLVGTDGGNPVRDAEVKLKGALRVRMNLQPGDTLYLSLSNASGEVIGAGEYEVDAIAFDPIKADGAVLGVTRVHKLAVKDEDGLSSTVQVPSE